MQEFTDKLVHEFQTPFGSSVLIFSLILSIILLAPIILNRFKIPGIIGLILSGMIIGPYGLFLIQKNSAVDLFSTIGLLYIMFIAGLEVDLHQFERYRRQSLLFGALTFGLPQALGIGAGVVLLGYPLPVAVLLGSVLASHTLVAYPLVSRLGLSKNAAVTTAVGATIITDTAALLVLAVVAGSAEGELDAAFWLRLGGLFAVYVVAVFAVLPRLGRWFFRAVRTSDGIAGFVFVLAAVFTTAFLAEPVGVEPIIGAFLAGLALNRLVPEQGTLMNRIQFVGDALFIPFFLISVGMIVDVGVFVEGVKAWIVAGVMLGVLFAGKAASSYHMAKQVIRLIHDVAAIVNDAGAKVMVVGPAFGPVVEKVERELATVATFVALGAHDRWPSFEAWLDHPIRPERLGDLPLDRHGEGVARTLLGELQSQVTSKVVDVCANDRNEPG